LDRDELPKYGEKPEGWKPSGTRITRGQYKTASGFVVNCDTQAAANIFRKVEAQLGLCLAKVCRAVLTLPTRVYLWNTKSKKRRGTALACLEITI
jgi:putative transposase